MSLSKRVRFLVLQRDRFTCQYCGSRAPDVELEIDHIHPVVSGGVDGLLNLVTACFDCNRGKTWRPLTTTPRAGAWVEPADPLDFPPLIITKEVTCEMPLTDAQLRICEQVYNAQCRGFDGLLREDDREDISESADCFRYGADPDEIGLTYEEAQ